jgi:hypothetical protein
MKRAGVSVGLLVLAALAWQGCAGDGSLLIDEMMDPEPGCPPAEPVAAPTLQELQDTVFTPYCAFCHGTGIAPFSLDSVEESFDNLVNVASLCEIPECQTKTEQGLQGQPRVIPCDPDNSYLLWKLENDPRIEGAPMPLGTSGLAGVDNGRQLLDDIRAWIEAGAQP